MNAHRLNLSVAMHGTQRALEVDNHSERCCTTMLCNQMVYCEGNVDLCMEVRGINRVIESQKDYRYILNLLFSQTASLTPSHASKNPCQRHF